MRIGIDFDNTIACYDNSFYEVALKRKWIEFSTKPNKQSVKKSMHNKKMFEEFTILQGLVYGKEILKAKVYDGFARFIKENCRKHELFIISHKTKYPIVGEKTNLHQAAHDFIKFNKLDYFVNSLHKRVFLEPKKEEKIKRTKLLDIDLFIDDLPKILGMDGFLNKTDKILFDPNKKEKGQSQLKIFSSWEDINNYLKSI
jgi:hypothetical protein